jgi:hypothetical protein
VSRTLIAGGVVLVAVVGGASFLRSEMAEKVAVADALANALDIGRGREGSAQKWELLYKETSYPAIRVGYCGLNEKPVASRGTSDFPSCSGSMEVCNTNSRSGTCRATQLNREETTRRPTESSGPVCSGGFFTARRCTLDLGYLPAKVVVSVTIVVD